MPDKEENEKPGSEKPDETGKNESPKQTDSGKVQLGATPTRPPEKISVKGGIIKEEPKHITEEVEKVGNLNEKDIKEGVPPTPPPKNPPEEPPKEPPKKRDE